MFLLSLKQCSNMKKALLVVFVCSQLAATAAGKKVFRSAGDALRTDPAVADLDGTTNDLGGKCVGNVFPNPEFHYTSLGKNHFQDMVPVARLEASLKDTTSLVDRKWTFGFSAESHETKAVEFGIMGGAFKLNVPAGAVGLFTITDVVETAADATRFEYRGDDDAGNVTIWDICLRPSSCQEAAFVCP
ncbi:unnamed protein product [Polarella glacialis]|uniref:Uncharacterized protein n=1 Tax=Polarella glacialis TaxID=89957 RepID=A0A813JYT4_POLGL|nr:unnamed protein product [Polarella glacialis]